MKIILSWRFAHKFHLNRQNSPTKAKYVKTTPKYKKHQIFGNICKKAGKL